MGMFDIVFAFNQSIKAAGDIYAVCGHKTLQSNQTINTKMYDEDMNKLKQAIQLKRHNQRYSVIIQHSNACPDFANMVKHLIKELGWKVPHSLRFPHSAAADYHLFRSLSVNLRGVSFNNDLKLKTWLNVLFESEPSELAREMISIRVTVIFTQ